MKRRWQTSSPAHIFILILDKVGLYIFQKHPLRVMYVSNAKWGQWDHKMGCFEWKSTIKIFPHKVFAVTPYGTNFVRVGDFLTEFEHIISYVCRL